jgi:hypothetical protein
MGCLLSRLHKASAEFIGCFIANLGHVAESAAPFVGDPTCLDAHSFQRGERQLERADSRLAHENENHGGGQEGAHRDVEGAQGTLGSQQALHHGAEG